MKQQVKVFNKEIIKDDKKFLSTKFNYKGKAIDLRFRQDSEKLANLKPGYQTIMVENLQMATSSFYPKAYCTFKGEIVDTSKGVELIIDDETGEIKE